MKRPPFFYRESHGIRVSVRPVFLPAQSQPAHSQFVFAYFVRLENVGDRNHRLLLAHLFSGQFKAMEVLKLKDIVESLESAIDAFETVANIVERIAVKES